MAPRLNLPLHTPRLRLRDFLPTDLQAIHAYASDPAVTRCMWYSLHDEADTMAHLQRMLQSQVERPRRPWELAIIRRSDDRLIGACNVTLECRHSAQLDAVELDEAVGGLAMNQHLDPDEMAVEIDGPARRVVDEPPITRLL
jgi:RimJ/RimL family protein N-acetyltransferase